MKWIAAAWEWLTKSRYTRSLEVENERLRGELQRWQNAMLETANLPSIREPGSDVKLPVVKKRLTPSQWRTKAEAMTMHVEEKKVQ